MHYNKSPRKGLFFQAHDISRFQPWEMSILWRLCETGAQVDESQGLLLQQKQAYHPEFQVYTCF